MNTKMRLHNNDEIGDSIESLESVHGTDRAIIYWLLLFVLGMAAISLPFLKVEMSVGALGQVRPTIERLSVYPAVEGIITDLWVADNRLVRRGERLLAIDSSSLDARILQNHRQREENQHSIDDLRFVLDSVDTLTELKTESSQDRFQAFCDGDRGILSISRLQTPQYIRQYTLFISDIQKGLLLRNIALRECARSKFLHDKKLVTDLSYDQARDAKDSAERELDLTVQETLGRWEADKIDRDLKKIDLDSESDQFIQDRIRYTVRAPVDGTALGFEGLHQGLFIPTGQRLGEISPEGGVQADVYLNTRDVGFVHIGQSVNVQVDAFPYTEWGTIKGRVRDISQDFVQQGQQVAFKAVIDLDATQLHSQKGAIVDLRRGMTVNARFVLRKRTLLNLLFTKLSESLDPTASKPMD